MTTNDASEIQRLIQVVQINDVRLVEAAVRTRITADEARPGQLIAHHRAELSRGIDRDGVFLVRAALRVRVVPNDANPDDEDPISLNVISELTYRVPQQESFRAETLEEFAAVNGVYNVWPYWRHFVQSTVVDMGLPRLVLPVFRIERRGLKTPAPEKTAQAAEERVAAGVPERAPKRGRAKRGTKKR